MPHAASHRLGDTAQSDIRLMTRECARVSGLNLGQGLCDVPTPPAICAGAIAAIEAGLASYSLPEGTPGLREAIAARLAADNGLVVDPEREIAVTAGATAAFACAVFGLLEPGDGILLPEPYYGYHLAEARLAGLVPQPVALEPPAFRLTRDALLAAVDAGARTRAIVLCTPSNPSGRMLDEEELAIVADVARRRDLLVITDEIYQYFRYDGRTHVSPASFEDLFDRTVSIMGFSKTFSVTGWRLGYAAGPERLIRPIVAVHDVYYICAPTPLQHGAEAALQSPPAFYDALAAAHQRKRDVLCDALRAAGAAPLVPEGAYYVLADVSAWCIPDSRGAALRLLEDAGVASIPGRAFWTGALGERYLRFCFGKDDDVIEEAARRIRGFRVR